MSAPNDGGHAVVITRDATGTVDGVHQTGRVFIAKFAYGSDIYSSTSNVDEATVFTRARAEQLLGQGKWYESMPTIEPAP